MNNIDIAILEKLYYNIFNMMCQVHWDYFSNPTYDNWIRYRCLRIELGEVKDLIHYLTI